MNDIKLKAGDKVKSLVDFFGIRKGDIVTVTHVGIGYISVAEDDGSTLTNEEFEVFIQEEPSQMTIETLLKLAKEYAEKAAESQRKSEELYEKADKMYKELRGGADEQVVVEDMSNPANWRDGDIFECVKTSRHHLAGCTYEVTGWDAVSGRDISVKDNEGIDWWAPVENFQWHSRPSQTDKRVYSKGGHSG